LPEKELLYFHPMNLDLVVTHSVSIKATPEQVWMLITDPGVIKVFLFGSEVTTDWKTGSPLFFRGEWQGQRYEDKGLIQQVAPPHLLQYTYHSGFSGLTDVPENYSLVTYTLEEAAGGTLLQVQQKGFAGEVQQQHSASGWKQALEKIKEVAETK
jgi:uncharacterized protein YndB with AHSA1/START domain